MLDWQLDIQPRTPAPLPYSRGRMEECLFGDLLFADERLRTARPCFTVPQSYSITCPISEAIEHVILHDSDRCH